MARTSNPPDNDSLANFLINLSNISLKSAGQIRLGHYWKKRPESSDLRAIRP